MSIQRFCFSISFLRKAASGCVKSGEQHIIGMTLPLSSTSLRKCGHFDSSCISINPAYHSSPSMSNLEASAIHSDNFMLPSLQSACMKAFGNAASFGIDVIYLERLIPHSTDWLRRCYLQIVCYHNVFGGLRAIMGYCSRSTT